MIGGHLRGCLAQHLRGGLLNGFCEESEGVVPQANGRREEFRCRLGYAVVNS